MTHREVAHSYLRAEGQTFWAWADGGRVLTWAGGPEGAGPTIAFDQELAQVLARLAPRGLPSFPAIVLVLGACREGWSEAADVAFARVAQAQPGGGPFMVHLQARTRDALRRIAALPAPLRSGAEAKATLVELVLEGAAIEASPAVAAAVVEQLEGGFTPFAIQENSESHRVRHARDLHLVLGGLVALGPGSLQERLELRRRTGLDAAPAPAEVEVEDEEPPSLRASRLIDELVRDPELGALARLARDLRAAVHVPRSVAHEDELPLGGVSDITNRGPLDRLLLSELAHDDLTFVVRVAMGEALYLRREAPPRGPEGGRALLVDGGVRLWGVGRVFATAVALAAAATAGRRMKIDAFTSRQGELVPLDLGTRDGLVAHLEALDASAHPGPALAAFLARAEQGDRVLVTHEDALADPELQRALRGALEGADAPLLVATVARDGTYRLRSVSARGQKVLSQARLDLRALLEPPATRSAPQSSPLAGEPRVPSILRAVPFPLQLPYPFDQERARHHPEHGVVALTRDGRLLVFPRGTGHSGAIQLTDQVPPGPLVWLELDDTGAASVVVRSGSGSGELTLVRERVWAGTMGPQRSKVEADPAPLAVVRRGAALLLIYGPHVDGISLETGQRAHRLRLPAGTHWRMGRFFTDAKGWFAIGADGLRPVLEPLPGFPRHVLAVFDRDGHEDPWAIEPDGVVLSGVGSSLTKVEHLLEGSTTYAGVAGISHDGHRLLLRAVDGVRHSHELLDLVTGSRRKHDAVAMSPRERSELLEPVVQRHLVGAPQLRTRLQSVGVDAQGRLTLVSRKGRPHVLLERDGWLFLGALDDPRLRALRSFEPREGYAGAGWSLSQATWPDGSRAFLDGRGLLHLVPAHGVEVSLVLAERALAAWTTDGEIVGPAYFTGRPDRGGLGMEAPTRAVLDHVSRFCLGIQ